MQFFPEKVTEIQPASYAPRVSIISKLINTCENDHEDDFSGSDGDFLGFYDE